MIDWGGIETVLLDMDGTLLDLNFDNYFWLEYLPARYAEILQRDPVMVRNELFAHYQRISGTLNWYSTTYWSEQLGIDVVAIKHEIRSRIRIIDGCEDFLEALQLAGKKIVMVTNAHHDSLALKMDETGLHSWFDRLISVHEFAIPKEQTECWHEVQQLHPFDPAHTLLIDDNLVALRSAHAYGIGHLLAVYLPDSGAAEKNPEEFQAMRSFSELLPVTIRE